MKKLWGSIFFTLLAVMIVGCDSEQPISEFEQVDNVPINELRIVSLAPSLTEILFALELDENIVGITTFCNYPEQTDSVKKIGSILEPDIETLVVLQPTHIFATDSMFHAELHDRLESLGLRCYSLKTDTVAEVIDSIKKVAEKCGISERGEKIASKLENEIEKYKKASSFLDQKKTLIVVQSDPLVVVGKNTFIAELLNYSGGNVDYLDGMSTYPHLNSESLLTLAPEVIIITDHSYTNEQKENILKGFNKWQNVPAVRDGNVCFLDADIISRPGPRAGLAVKLLAEAIHPEFDWDNLE